MIVNVKMARLTRRMTRLFARRRDLERRIDEEMKRPQPDALQLQSLKRLRLRAKDEITAIRRRLRGARPRPADPLTV